MNLWTWASPERRSSNMVGKFHSISAKGLMRYSSLMASAHKQKGGFRSLLRGGITVMAGDEAGRSRLTSLSGFPTYPSLHVSY